MMVRRVALCGRAASWSCHCGFVRSRCIGGEERWIRNGCVFSCCLGLEKLSYRSSNDSGGK